MGWFIDPNNIDLGMQVSLQLVSFSGLGTCNSVSETGVGIKVGQGIVSIGNVHTIHCRGYTTYLRVVARARLYYNPLPVP